MKRKTKRQRYSERRRYYINNKKRKNNIQLVISGLIFVLFSIVLFINNFTDLLTKYGVNYNLTIITWIGLIGSTIYAIVLILLRGELR